MSLETFLSKNLQKFTVIDIAFVKLVYLALSFLIFAYYPPLTKIDWWAYLVLGAIAMLPLLIHEFSVKGSLMKKVKNYVKTNNPSNQILLFFSVFFFGFMLCSLFPVLAGYDWWVYVAAIVVLTIKPAMHNVWW